MYCTVYMKTAGEGKVVTVWSTNKRKKNEAIRNVDIFVNFYSNKKIFQLEIRKDHKFFPHINKVIGPLLQKILAKIHSPLFKIMHNPAALSASSVLKAPVKRDIIIIRIKRSGCV